MLQIAVAVVVVVAGVAATVLLMYYVLWNRGWLPIRPFCSSSLYYFVCNVNAWNDWC